LAAFALSALPVEASLLVNDNFNTGDLTGWWTYSADANSTFTVENTGGFSLNGSPYAHAMVRDTSPDPILGQNVSVAGGIQYQLSLEYRGNNWGGAGVGIWYYDASYTQIAQYEWAGLYSGTGADTGWVSATTPVWTTPANAAYLSVRLDGWGWSDTYYDNVNLNVVPEPGFGALLGVGGLLMIRRWNTRARR
jgi:hypothetical protein